jgi:hypothetical protein
MKTLTTGRKSFLVSIVASLVTALLGLSAGWAYANETPEVVCVESEPVWVCEAPRELEQGSGTVRECSWVRQIVCESVGVNESK